MSSLFAERPLRLPLAALATLALLGCGKGPFDVAPVSGSIAYEDGSLIPSNDYRLKFVPQVESPDGKSFPRVATALVGGDGKFDFVTTYRYKDGLTVGEHLVYLKIEPSGDGQPLVPQEYLSSTSTPLKIDVRETRRFDLKVPKP